MSLFALICMVKPKLYLVDLLSTYYTRQYFHDPKFSCFDTIPECNRHTHTQTHDGIYRANIASRGKPHLFTHCRQLVFTFSEVYIPFSRQHDRQTDKPRQLVSRQRIILPHLTFTQLIHSFTAISQCFHNGFHRTLC